MPTRNPHALTRQKQRAPSTIDPKVVELRNDLEHALLSEIKLHAVIPKMVQWMVRRLGTWVDEEGVEQPAIVVTKDDDPLVKMVSKAWDKIIPERRQIESNAPTGNLVAGAVLVLGGNGAIQRGTAKAHEHAIEVTAVKRARYDETEAGSGLDARDAN